MIRTPRARTVLTKSELQLFSSSFAAPVKALSPAQLKAATARARELRNKYRDEAARQQREARGKAAPRGTQPAKGNERTLLKAQIFAEVLERFAAAASSATSAPSKKKTAKKKAAKNSATKKGAARQSAATKSGSRTLDTSGWYGNKSSSAKKGTSPRKALAKHNEEILDSQARRAATKAASMRRTGATKHQGHVAARGRRRQAKRDAKSR